MKATFNQFIAGMVIGTVCISFLGVLFMAFQGKIDPAPIVTFILTSISSLIAAAGAYFVTNSKSKTEQSMAYMRGMEAKSTEYSQAFKRYGSMDYTAMGKGARQ